MALFQRKKQDPAADAYRKLTRENALKKKFDFIGKTGKMDDDIEHKKSYKTAEDKFKDIVSKPLDEEYGDRKAWYPMEDSHSLDTLNSDHPVEVAKKSEWIKEMLRHGLRDGGHDIMGRILEEAPLPHSAKHKIAVDMFHHDTSTRFKRDTNRDEMTDEKFHASKTPIDRVLEEMTRHRPNEENRERIRAGINAFKGTDDNLHKYLKEKYRFALDEEPVQPFKHYEPEEQVLTHDEVMKHKDTHSFFNGRVLAKPDPKMGVWEQKKYQLHPDGSLTRVSGLLPHVTHTFDGMPFKTDDHMKQQHFHANNLEDMHGDHIRNSGIHNEITRYTNDSREFNKYLASGVVGTEWDDEETKKYKSHSYDEMANRMSSAMLNAPPYAHKFSVWTGLSKSNDVGKYAATKKDDREKLIGHFPAFTSTSLNPGEAAGFAKAKTSEMFPHHDEVRDILRVDIPKAYHRGLYVEKHSYTPGEQEYIMDRNTTMEIHPKPLYYARTNQLYRVWKGRPILSDEDQEIVNQRAKHARQH